MVQGLRVVFSPDRVRRSARVNGLPEAGARGTVTVGLTGNGPRTYLGAENGLVYVQWDRDGSVSTVSMRDLRLEPAEDLSER